MSRDGSNCFVLTGGPGSGKSTLIEAFAAAGFPIAAEAGRAVIRDQMAIDGRALPWIDPLLFAEMMLARDLQSHAEHAGRDGPAFFDRGIPDVIGYLALAGVPVPDHMRKAAALYRYNGHVFVCPPWPEIFTQDRERRQTPEEAERTYVAMTRTYADCGYCLIEVPRTKTAARRQFVLDALARLM